MNSTRVRRHLGQVDLPPRSPGAAGPGSARRQVRGGAVVDGNGQSLRKGGGRAHRPEPTTWPGGVGVTVDGGGILGVWPRTSRTSRSPPPRRTPSSTSSSPRSPSHHADVDARRSSGAPTCSPRSATAPSCAAPASPSSRTPSGCAPHRRRARPGPGTAVAAALLHDTVEDTGRDARGDRARLRRRGRRAGGRGHQADPKIHFESQEEHQAENYRKLIVSMSSDIRVLVIKLADRLHNMRTLSYMTKPSRSRRPRRRSRSTRRWPTAWASTRSSGSSRTWPSPRCTPAATARSSRWSTSAGPTARSSSRRPARILATRARGRGHHRRRDHRAGEALLLDLREDDPQGQGVQRDLRPHRDAGARGLGQGLLRRRRHHPLALEAAARALQGLHRHAQAQHVPVAAHDGHRARGQAARDPDPHVRDAPHGRVRRRRPLALQGARRRRTATSRPGCRG